ncbi:serine hydrolase domain-containing protein [Streptomyces sp. NPDC048111]|uniref:serine hydrolase domain-containing protein n=1 Tax=Streptomyces sp. NPDC048111 TaxID=3365500 RepID=UPI0037103865
MLRTRLARTVTTLAVAVALTAGGTTGALGASRGPARPAPDAVAVRTALLHVRDAGAPGAFAVIRDHTRWGLDRTLTVGKADLDGTPMRADARIRIGSNTKMFTAALVLGLAERGLIALDRPLRRYLPPGTLPADWTITARQALTHRAGLYDHVNDLLEQNGEETTSAFEARIRDRVYDPRDLVARSVRHGLQHPPGSAYAYANTGFVLLGLAAEHVTGRPYAELLRERILEPLGLRRTSFTVPERRITGRHISGYLTPDDPRLPLLDATEQNGSWIGSAGAAVSSARDLDRFLTRLLAGSAGGLVRDDSLRQMTRALPTGAPSTAYGLGLRRITLSCGAVFGHGGIVQGYQSQAYATPDGRRTVVVFANASNNGAVTQGLLDALEPAFCGAAPAGRSARHVPGAAQDTGV